MPRKKTLIINFVLDETGSMGVVREATISGFNEYLNTLKTRKENILFTLTQFNSQKVQVVCDAVSIKDMAELNHDTYNPYMNTPLYDAVAHTIKTTESKVSSMKGKPAVLCVIQTDGQENASKEYTRDGIFKLITDKKNDGWEFVFMGADQDAWLIGRSMGVPIGSTIAYDNTNEGTKQVFAMTATATMDSVKRGGAATSNFYGGQKDIRERAGMKK